MDEQHLVEQLRQGDRNAFAFLVSTFQKRLLKVAYGITLDPEESREIVQEVFITVFRQIHSFRQEAALYTWLRKMTVNHCLNWKRRWKRRFRWHHDPITRENDPSLFQEQTPMETPETLMQKKQFQERLMDAVKHLPEKTRTVFVLYALEELSYEEIADFLQIRKGTVASRLYHARKQVAQVLNPKQIQEKPV
ncbi:MAG: sigma-70 family RNA polymerase sigma factor [Desulfotignum sp.]|nr:sigma-70 family RNA polymerase sigma factor [Desulfotignum sp.]MCF8088192.1 sigma-70 family RNA polymerase sigma factor [Desulfotignum sp.]MCF8136025.1 sigma-70 family RNA polymerase sigma factor [Desulfotignum sp.]